jgi:hypothetical protein
VSVFLRSAVAATRAMLQAGSTRSTTSPSSSSTRRSTPLGRRVLGLDIDGEIADSCFGHSGLTLAAGATPSRFHWFHDGQVDATVSRLSQTHALTAPGRVGHPVERPLHYAAPGSWRAAYWCSPSR